MSCPPRFGTPRTPERASLGPRVAQVAKALGLPLMPWQRHVVDVALEVDEDGVPVYREVRVTVPRQSGKTTLLLAVAVHRCLGFGRAQRVLWAAQDRNSARAKLVDEMWPLLEGTPFRPLFTKRLSNGSEQLQWRNGSRWGIVAPTATAGHGETLDLAVVDEAFAQVDDRLDQAFGPAMITRRLAQQWVISTAGTDESTYLWAKVEDGRERCAAGITRDVAYFEWSAPDDAPTGDPATWRGCMPALGHTVTEEAIRVEFERLQPGEFARAYLNRRTAAAEQVIPPEAWAACRDERSTLQGRPVFAVDVSIDRQAAAIAVAGARAGGAHLEVIDHRPGTDWVAGRLRELQARWRPYAVHADVGGPAGSLLVPCREVGVDLSPVTARQHAQACGGLYDAVVQGTVRHLGQGSLDAAVAGARQRPLGDAWAWGRRHASVDLSPLVAVTLAYWGHLEAQGARVTIA